MHKTFLLFGLIALTLLSVVAQERIDLTVAETKPTNPSYWLSAIALTYNNPNTATDESAIVLSLVGQNGEARNCVYSSTTTPAAGALLIALNKANLSSAYAGNATTGSLSQRIFHRLVVMNEAATICGGALVGSLAGTPQ